MVLQKNILFSGTIKDNLKWGNKNATDEELDLVCNIAQATEIINKMTIEKLEDLGLLCRI